MTKSIRGNGLLLILVAAVTAVTGLNQYTTQQNAKTYLDALKYNTEDRQATVMIQETQYILAARDRQLDAAMATLMAQTNRLDQAEQAAVFFKQVADSAITHIQKCHALLEKNNIKPPVLDGAGEKAPSKEKKKDSTA